MVDAEKVTEIPEECERALKCLWEDKGIQKCFERRNEFQISDSTKLLVHRFIHTLYVHIEINTGMLFTPSLQLLGSPRHSLSTQLHSNY